MKKVYLNPQTKVIVIAPAQIAAGSPEGTINPNQSQRITTSDGFGSRSTGWDDDE